MSENINRIMLKEKLTSIHLFTSKARDSAVLARNNCKEDKQRIMLAGKVKAYTEVLCLIQTKFKKDLDYSVIK